MKKIVLLVLIGLLTACSPVPTQTQITNTVETINTEVPKMPSITESQVTQPTTVTLDTFKNIKITAPELKKDVQLVDGQWSETQADGSIQRVNLDTHFASGDLNGDGVVDAALIITESMGGSGTFYSVGAFVNQQGSYIQVGTSQIDDRAIIHSLEISDGEIILNANVHGVNDAMVDPSVNVTRIYRLFNNQLVFWRQTQLLNDRKVREINITSPIEYQEVSGSLVLIGNMPIAPFENTLRIQILNANLDPVYTSAMMVSSEDAGMPATINSAISIGTLIPGEFVLIQLAEMSMADGSVMALDTVAVTIK